MTRHTLIWGHRGASRDEAENTIAAFVVARDQGADGVELDVRRTADGGLAVIHDAALPDGTLVRSLATADLPGSVPTLEQALDACEGMTVNVEIKNFPGDADFDPDAAIVATVVEVLAARPHADVIVSCFDPRTVATVRELAPHLPTALLTIENPALDALGVAVAAGHVALHPYESAVTAELVEAAHTAGLAVNTWTVDDADRLRALAALGVDAVITNRPADARAALDAR